MTYRPLAEVLREELGLLETDPAETVRRRLRGREILGLTLGLDAGAELHPLDARSRLHEGWVELLTELAAERPVVVLIEDLHWAQEPLLDLVERLVEDVRGPLLVVGTARPELDGRAARLGAAPRRDDGLARAARGRRRAARARERAPATSPTTLPRPRARAGRGQSLLPRGAAREPRRARSAPSRASRTRSRPCSRRASTCCRRPRRRRSRRPSVIGRSFWRGPVARAARRARRPTSRCSSRATSSAAARRPSLAGEREFAFKHALTRDVAYASLPTASRARLHAAFAEWLEGVAEGRGEHAAPARAPLRGGRPARGRRSRLGGRPRRLERAARAARSRGSAAPPSSRSAATTSTRRSRCSSARSSSRPTPRRSSSSGRLIGRANALRHDGEPFLAAMMRAIELSPDAGDDGGALRRALVRDRAARGHVAPAARPRARRRLDRPGARARRARQRGPGAGADRPLRLEPGRLADLRAGGERDRRAARRRRAALVRLGRPRDHGVGRGRARPRARLGGAPLRADRPDQRPRPRRRHLLRARHGLRLARVLRRGAAARAGATTRSRARSPTTTASTGSPCSSRSRSSPAAGSGSAARGAGRT